VKKPSKQTYTVMRKNDPVLLQPSYRLAVTRKTALRRATLDFPGLDGPGRPTNQAEK